MSAERKDWYARTMGDTAANEALFDVLSVRQFPPQVFNTAVPEDWTKPQDFDGFLEQDHKEYLQGEGLL
ncbi:hypothetical protein B0A55_02614 [Friedmanniomyces simplex]|uniref:Uncharacterized protein n=1 Tax=Friedmanniomyces simplex TaxID=329884 RepID=A0A4U0Y0Z8_9PEZI|nr:hypothetical protein B0A55_02614 [Friedmanniomyces simplex]